MDVVDPIRPARFTARRHGGSDSRLASVRTVHSHLIVTATLHGILVEIFTDEAMVDVTGDRQIPGFVERLSSLCVAAFDLGGEFAEVVVHA